MQECNLTWNQIKYENETSIDKKIRTYFNAIPSHTYSHYSQFTQNNNKELPKNTIYQRDLVAKIKAANKKITKYEQMYNICMDKSFKETLKSSIISEKQIVTDQTKRLKKLKCYAEAQARLTEKKAKLLEDIVEKYDGPKRPLVAMIDLNL
ncbi:23674_t:CDS:2 [Gigaspora margarita]|uniref:23674_t:CDS:1 n=1 Tax=Gigaspora margarita TaxID=4874 RepID=A0ABN7VLD6_GIGMA|nr:23674_t:CDS:2 [Gigaspora margarita]